MGPTFLFHFAERNNREPSPRPGWGTRIFQVQEEEDAQGFCCGGILWRIQWTYGGRPSQPMLKSTKSQKREIRSEKMQIALKKSFKTKMLRLKFEPGPKFSDFCYLLRLRRWPLQSTAFQTCTSSCGSGSIPGLRAPDKTNTKVTSVNTDVSLNYIFKQLLIKLSTCSIFLHRILCFAAIKMLYVAAL